MVEETLDAGEGNRPPAKATVTLTMTMTLTLTMPMPKRERESAANAHKFRTLPFRRFGRCEDMVFN